jgi:hypothetical protein
MHAVKTMIEEPTSIGRDRGAFRFKEVCGVVRPGQPTV